MSFYELDRPAARPRRASAFARFRKGFRASMDALNESRLKSALYSLDDVTLAKVGITRADIPAYARRCLSHED